MDPQQTSHEPETTNGPPPVPQQQSKPGVSMRVFNITCLILGCIFTLVGMGTWVLAGQAIVGIPILGCAGIMITMAITGLREGKSKKDKK